MRKHSHDSDAHRGPDLTPMLDVVFIMLIFFIVTASFVRESGIEAGSREASHNPPPESVRPIRVDIAGNDQLSVNGKPVDHRLLGAQLARLHAQQPEAAVVVGAHAASTTQALVLVMDTARNEGLYDIKFLE